MSFVHLHTHSEYSLLDGANRLTDLVQDEYTLDYDYWGGSPFTLGVTLVTADTVLGRTALEMLASPKWSSGNNYTWVIE